MSIIKQIKAEIERRKSLLTQHSKLTYNLIIETFIKEYDSLLSFLSTLESEKPINQEGLEEELDKWRHNHFNGKRDENFSGEYLERTSQLDLASHFAQWGAEHLAYARKTSPKDLEEAAEEYIKKGKYLPEAFVVRPAFIAGAKWMKEQLKK